MGRWGKGTFDSDETLDFLGSVGDFIEARVKSRLEQCLSDPEFKSWYDGFEEIVPAVGMLWRIVDAFPNKFFVDVSTVAKLRQAFDEWKQTATLTDLGKEMLVNADEEFAELAKRAVDLGFG